MYNDCNICESSDKELESYVKTTGLMKPPSTG